MLLSFLPGLTLSLVVRPIASMTTSATLTLTEDGTEAGEYSGTTALVNGEFAVAVLSSGNKIADDFLSLGADGGTYRVGVTAIHAAGYTIINTIGGSGTGARTVTITVNDGANVLENARIRLTQGVNTFRNDTDVSGVAVFNLDDATYVVSITKAGYTYAGTSLVVDGTEAVTYSMTAIIPAAPADPPLCAVTFHVRNQFGDDIENVPIEITFIRFTVDAASSPPVLSPMLPLVATDAFGIATVDLYRDAEYKAVFGTYPTTRRVDFTVPDAGTYEVGET